ncbi:MAG: 2-oxoacid:ferredoxin oxidoreductase, gamma subunit [Promethearchaeota archaeon]|nr:MAG: 2-oxoacid:ferredoxin oxidoreductase, gamma subunit [Candidatus Lokiarchaeota archaeon]
MARYEIRIIGFGGQGVITLSKMIITAASLYEGLAATQTEAYSAAARGGKCWAEVVVDLDQDQSQIDYPKALAPYDFSIVLSEEGASEMKKGDLKDEKNTGFLLWDTSTIKKFRTAKRVKALGIPIQKLALEKFGNSVFGNTILFGAFMKISNIFSEEAAIETIKKFVPESTLDTNLKAFEFGKQKGEKFLQTLMEAN